MLSKLHIWVVDRDRFMGFCINRQLKYIVRDISIDIFETPNEAWHELMTADKAPDLLFLDLDSTDMAGGENLLFRMNELYGDEAPRVVLVGGNQAKHDKLQANNIIGILAKPLSLEGLKEVMKNGYAVK